MCEVTDVSNVSVFVCVCESLCVCVSKRETEQNQEGLHEQMIDLAN